MFTKDRTKRLASILIAGGVLVAAVSACSTADSADSASALPVLKIGQVGQFTQQSIEASGVLDDAPFTVEWSSFTSGADAAGSLVSGINDAVVNTGNIAPLVHSANAQDPWTTDTAPYKTILALADHDPIDHPSQVTVVSPRAGITSGDQLSDKRWSYLPGANNEVTAIYSARKAGIEPADINAVKLDDPTAIQALITGDLDVWSGPKYNAIAALDAGALVLWNGIDIGFQGYTTLAANTASLADSATSDALGLFAERFAQFHIWAQTHTDQLVPVYQRASKLDERLAQIRSEYVFDVVPISDQVVASQQELADTLVSTGFLRQNVDVAALYDDRYSAQVTSVLDSGTP